MIYRCKWIFENKDIRLNDFTAFQYRGKPVNDFQNWNDAWFVTNWFIEKMIKNNLYSNDWDKWDEELKVIESQEVNDLLNRQIRGELNKNN